MSNSEKYYGGFFWVAMVSFIVPVFVAIAAFNNIRPTTKPTPNPDASGVDHAIWDYLLKSYVANGLVDYQGIQKDYLFREYIRELGNANPDALKTQEEKLALACNAYNAFVINGVVTHKIKDTVIPDPDTLCFFDLKEHIFAGKTISLNELEHEMIRPTFKEPRIHVALVCAAKSCPSIRPEAYIGSRLDQQLQDQSIQFANNKTYVEYNKESGELLLSSILNWYGDDWNEKYPNGGYLRWIAELTKDEAIKSACQDAITGKASVKFKPYDWALNSQADPQVGDHSAGGFGSGSLPDQ